MKYSLSTQANNVAYMFLLVSCLSCNMKENTSSDKDGPSSICGIKWNTPFSDALKYCQNNENNKIAPNGGKSYISYDGPLHGGVENSVYSIEIYNYNLEGVVGHVQYYFTPDSTMVNQKPPRFKRADFYNLEHQQRISSDYDNYAKIYDQVVKEDKRDFKKIDSIYTALYGEAQTSNTTMNNQEFRKSWEFKDHTTIQMSCMSDSARESYHTFTIQWFSH